MDEMLAGRPLDGPAQMDDAMDDLLAARERPALLALGEPTHGIAAFPAVRNEMLATLVERGFRSIALETDLFAATVVDDYVAGGSGDLDEVLATGFSHGFGNLPGNRELVQWLRRFNAGREPADRIRFHGFDAPLETAAAPSPRRFLLAVRDALPPGQRPGSAAGLDTLLGDDAEWANPAAMGEPAASIGGSVRVRDLRIVADDLASALHRAGPGLASDPDRDDDAAAHARTALGLLRYHAAMARPGPDRIGTLLSLRSEMMADNLLAVVDRERDRGPTLVFAHNVHLQRAPSEMSFGAEDTTWWSAGAMVARTLGPRYAVVLTDAAPAADPATFPGVLAAATTRRTLFPTAALRAALPLAIEPGEPILPGHIPVRPADLAGADALIFVADTDGRRQQYW
ncbi:erythromycin esterase family protein [Nakamurella sp.]|uniref:erythromycin esterase family protein n=1 Tax=Nakamurella sp. TaxID=1869182 RepID=UPI003B3B9819